VSICKQHGMSSTKEHAAGWLEFGNLWICQYGVQELKDRQTRIFESIEDRLYYVHS